MRGERDSETDYGTKAMQAKVHQCDDAALEATARGQISDRVCVKCASGSQHAHAPMIQPQWIPAGPNPQPVRRRHSTGSFARVRNARSGKQIVTATAAGTNPNESEFARIKDRCNRARAGALKMSERLRSACRSLNTASSHGATPDCIHNAVWHTSQQMQCAVSDFLYCRDEMRELAHAIRNFQMNTQERNSNGSTTSVTDAHDGQRTAQAGAPLDGLHEDAGWKSDGSHTHTLHEELQYVRAENERLRKRIATLEAAQPQTLSADQGKKLGQEEADDVEQKLRRLRASLEGQNSQLPAPRGGIEAEIQCIELLMEAQKVSLREVCEREKRTQEKLEAVKTSEQRESQRSLSEGEQNEKLHSLQSELECMKSSLSSSLQRETQAMEHAESLKSELEALKEKESDLQRKLSDSNAELDEKRMKESKLEQMLNESKIELGESRKLQKELQENVWQERQRRERLEAHVACYERAADDSEQSKLLSSLEEAHSRAHDAEARADRLEQERKNADVRVSELQYANEALNNEIVDLKAKVNSAEAEKSKASSLEMAQSELKERLATMSESVDTMQKEAILLQKCIAERAISKASMNVQAMIDRTQALLSKFQAIESSYLCVN